ncbi:Patatin-like phospholipase [Tranquillimonas alkanivorans]|uniref:Patatin-like phospholipase n=2 Tax=Tranquillimonas alkanivorans TaxID=441119 RepID=A0A1I5VPC4_9RHOB|nr:Patatin-like phospholipase [Tranquillimonas alkanivorans]
MREVAEAMSSQGTRIFGTKAPPSSQVGVLLDLFAHRATARYSAKPLRKLICDVVGEDTFIGDLKQKTIVPAVNVTKGSPQVFKTSHHENFQRDWKLPVVDVAMATSAAPTFFPLHKIGSERFADGGIYTNSPDEIAVHEALHFLGQDVGDTEILSVGTTTAKFSFPGKLASNMGYKDWLTDQRLISVMISAQQMNTDFMMRHRFGERYVRVDSAPSASQLPEMRLDNASKSVSDDLKGLADASLREHLPGIRASGFFDYDAGEEDFLQREEVSNFFRDLRGDDGDCRKAFLQS